ncbi:O-fucosyltransferase family protein [Paenibacillus durus]|uniref:O-fucosyltransferase family protein n=1 Tax=Paenibacillus durus TaxID=44251 RepID=UPI00046F0EA1|nr:O-fucosyltransferase family protein [Paenibacillus durus]
MNRLRFMLIRGYSHSIWMDIRQLLEQLLIAELSGRIPVVHWGSSSFYNGKVYTNAFDKYFEPVSNYMIEDLMNPGYSFFPSVWQHDNLLMPDPGQVSLTERNYGEMLESNADVVVCDTYPNKMSALSLVGEDHPLYGMDTTQAYRFLMRKYLKLKPDLTNKIMRFFYSNSLHEGPVLAVHVRENFSISAFEKNSINKHYHGKVYKMKKQPEQNTNDTLKLHQIYRIYKVNKLETSNKDYHKEIQYMLGKFNIKKIFLLTDCTEILDEYRERYGSLLVYTDALRHSSNDVETPYLETHMHRRQNGIDAILDAYIAAKCSFFIGNGYSNMSKAVTYLNDWADTNVKLMYWVPENSSLANYAVTNTTVYPNNKLVGKFKQIAYSTHRTWKRLKDR